MSKSKIKVCIIGASGFVGRALVERLLTRNDVDIKVVIRSPGNAWSILRHDLDVVQADVLNIESLREAVKGCSHVVNLSLGSFNDLAVGITNIIKVCKEFEVKRLVHLSSITVYGDSPHQDSAIETGPMLAKEGTYGWFKAEQDVIVEAANNTGLSSVVLCPPHITGAYGRIFHQVIDSIKKGTFALIDGGRYPCNLVDINNLCDAIESSLEVTHSDGRRIFVTNGDDYTWRDLTEQAARIAGVDASNIPSISAAECFEVSVPKMSLFQLIKNILKYPDTKAYVMNTFIGQSSILRPILKKIARVLGVARSGKSSLPGISHERLPQMNYGLCRQQLRGVQHKIDRAEDILNYRPKVSSIESFEMFEEYYETLFGYGSEYWDLANK